MSAAAVVAAATLLVGGAKRHYLLARPPSSDAALRPLVIVLHGHGGSAAQALGLKRRGQSAFALWPEIAARENILVAAPDGLEGADGKQGWNDCRSDAVNNPTSDDVSFLDDLIAFLILQESADPARIYVAGMSNGAMMTLRAALELKHRPAAVAAVCGLMAEKSACGPPATPVSVMLVEGTADPLVPYEGGKVGFGPQGQDRGHVISADASIAYWLKADRIKAEPVSEKLSPSVTRTSWGTQVQLIRVEGGGHVEPSKRVKAGWLYTKLVGPQNRDFETAEEAWAFFKDKRGR